MKNMEYDPQMAERVWKRVQGCDTGSAPLEELIAQEWLDGSICLGLAQRCRGKKRALLRRVGQEKREHVRCLKGIGYLRTGSVPRVEKPPLGALELGDCCRGIRRCEDHYRQLMKDMEYGTDFAKLADSAARHNRLLLPLLGEEKKAVSK